MNKPPCVHVYSDRERTAAPCATVPAKGLHTPEQAYVEYNKGGEGGGGAALDKDKLMTDLKAEMNRLVTAGGASAAGSMVRGGET